MSVQWKDDLNAALADAKQSQKPVLLDFSAAPA
jgi:Thioredoxin-like